MPINIDAMRKRLRSVKAIGEFAREANVDRSTVRRIRDTDYDPSVSVYNKIEAALRAMRGGNKRARA